MANPAPLSPQSCVVCTEGFIASEVDGEVVALNIDKGTCYGLNRVGSRVWSLMAAPVSVSELCAELVRRYDVDLATCQVQVLDLLEELRTEGMIEVRDTAAQP